ncbi:unnamed protein product [Kluyveromyces dobzhanskii CBS 2104]|uniref:WGS project CCBQ000000000 data, contig 00102 n=1 Tax=Kluyveromyces dobzhanskii CBS 2104 TaxID=1427455 RepID=A0A0A8L6D2_9SACH|nr:unnamed protein product [Kluyveromyces dobzhanskii CBS 2104]
MPNTLELLVELVNLIKLETKCSAEDLPLDQNDKGVFNWDEILQELIKLMKHDYISRKKMAVQLQSKELLLKELEIKVTNLNNSLTDYGQLKYHLLKQLELNDRLQRQVNEYTNEFKELRCEIKSMRKTIPKSSRRP